MNNPRRNSRRESNEELEVVQQYNSDYMSQCVLGIEKFFLAFKTENDEDIVQSLLYLSEELTMAEEQVLISQPLDKVLSLLLELLAKPNPDLLLHSMTCITLILDTLPELSEVIIECDGVKTICEKINSLTSIEVCDQGIRSLEKISLEYPLESLESGSIETCLNIMNYLDTEIQKKVLNIMCNCIKVLQSQECAEVLVLPIFPKILELIKNKPNSFRIEKTLEFISYFIENLLIVTPLKGDSFKPYAKALIDYGLVNVLLELFPLQGDYVLRLLYVLCERSSLVVKKFWSIGGFSIIKNGIEGQSLKTIGLSAILDLLDSILPKIPASDSWNKEKLKFFSQNAKYMQEISELILPRTKSIAEKFLSKEDKIVMISILEKILKISNIETISNYLVCQSFSTFLSELTASKDLSTVRAALRISLNLYEKIPAKISGNFAREGVVSRISALKDPERLREFKKLPERGNNEEIVFGIGDSKNPYLIESQNRSKNKVSKPTLDDYKKELQFYAKKILEKHKSFENKKALRIGKEIKMISQKLSSSFGESAAEILMKMIHLFSSTEKLSYYEISNSSIAENLWKWLTDGPFDKLQIRVSEFLRIFLRDSAYNESFFAVLVKYLIGTANFVHHFRILLHDSKALLSKRSAKAKILLEYIEPSSTQNMSDQDFKTRNDLFLMNNKIQITSSVLLTIEKLRELLIRVSTQSDLYTLVQQKIISETTVHMFLDRPYASSYQVVISSGTKELSRSTTVLNICSKKAVIHLNFKIIKRPNADLVFKFLKTPAEIFECIIAESSSVGIEPKDKSYPYLRLAKYLNYISDHLPYLNYLIGAPNMSPVPNETFICPKLSALLSRQLQDLVSTEGNAPASWIKSLPFKSKYLFSADSRHNYLEGFGFASISHIEKKFKAKVNRSDLLKEAISLFKDSGLHMETILEIEFEGEVGTGLGPTVEFFAQVSNEIKKLKIWRNMCSESGLFPAPAAEIDEEVFEFIGRFIGKAIIDKKFIDVQLSSAFWKLIFNLPLSLLDLQFVDKNIGKHLVNISLNPEQIEKTGLVFTLPGYQNICLKPFGASTLVTKDNIEEYIQLVCALTLNQIPQAKAVRKGIDSIVPVDVLAMLSVSEIEDLLLGENDGMWDYEMLKSSIVPSHGFCENSKTFLNLLSTMSRFDSEHRKRFLEFVTGFPRLPLGGFEKLQPKLSVVKKDVSDNPDECLPSVMTCQNYLKIPEYSSLEILERKLRMAICEGRQAFHLS